LSNCYDKSCDINVIAGDDWLITINIINYCDEANVLTDGTLHFTMKENISDPDPGVASYDSPVLVDPLTHDIDISNAVTSTIPSGSYYYDIQFTDSNGNITTLHTGKICVCDQITQRSN